MRIIYVALHLSELRLSRKTVRSVLLPGIENSCYNAPCCDGARACGTTMREEYLSRNLPSSLTWLMHFVNFVLDQL